MNVLEGLQPEVKSRALLLKNRLKDKGIDIVFTSGFRDSVKQQEVWNKGRDASGKVIDITKVVTWAKPFWSFHNYGLALDLVPLKDGKPFWNAPEEIWNKIGIEAENIGFIWGGRWKGKKNDKPHIEYHPGLSIADVYSHFKKTGQVLISKLPNPLILLIIGAGTIFF